MKINEINDLGEGNFSVHVTFSTGETGTYNFNHTMSENDMFIETLKGFDLEKVRTFKERVKKVKDLKKKFEGKTLKVDN